MLKTSRDCFMGFAPLADIASLLFFVFWERSTQITAPKYIFAPSKNKEIYMCSESSLTSFDFVVQTDESRLMLDVSGVPFHELKISLYFQGC